MKKLLASFLLAVSLATPTFAQAPPLSGSTVVQTRPAGSGGPTLDDVTTYVGSVLNLNPSMLDFVGDSRTTLINVGGIPGIGTDGQSWFNQANALGGQRYTLGLQQGGSGCRTDQFLSPANLNPTLTSPAGWLVINQGLVNDLTANAGNAVLTNNACANTPSAFPYTNNFGEVVTATNVGQIAANHIISAAKSAMARGKRVILISETGAGNPNALSSAAIAQMYDATAREQAFARAYPGQVFYIDLQHAIANPAASSAVLTYVTGAKSDGVHETVLGGYLEGVVFNSAMGSLFPSSDQQIDTLVNSNTNSAHQLIGNPLFSTLTGGIAGGSCTNGITGNVPSLWTVSCTTGANVSAITITSAASTWCAVAGSCGNDITIAITCTGAATVTFSPNSPSNALWSLSDTLQFVLNVSVASGSSNFAVYNETSIFTDQGNVDHWGLYAGSGAVYGPGPTTAYSYTLASQPGSAITGSQTQISTQGKLYMFCSAAGNGTVTINRASFNRL